MASSGSEDPKLSPEIEKLSKQLEADPLSKAFIPLGEEYVKAGLLEEAAIVLEDGVKIYPTFTTALVALGRVYVQLEQLPKAYEVLQEAARINPDNLVAHRTLARIYADQGILDAARQCCEKVLFVHPKDEEILALKADLEAKATQRGDDGAPATPEQVQPTDKFDPVDAAGKDPSAEAAAAGKTLQGADQADSEAAVDTAGADDAAAGGNAKLTALEKALERVRERRSS